MMNKTLDDLPMEDWRNDPANTPDYITNGEQQMKVTADDYDMIANALINTIERKAIDPDSITDYRAAWDVLAQACELDVLSWNELYEKYNDTHLETALGRIFDL